MPLPLNRAGNTSTDGSPQLKREVRRNGKKNKSRKVKAFRRNAYKVKNPRITPKGVGKPDGGNLSSRKIVWLEKLKHYLNIGACNFQLKLHLYSGQEGRESLK
ncbi:hypothetical protein, partial [Endozoicomonas sp.]|uniref:hypothetical protein n=1 Tax=Endozoicomonas sp. TaxID=1892382 RepID=UPI00383BA8B8